MGKGERECDCDGEIWRRPDRELEVVATGNGMGYHNNKPEGASLSRGEG